MGLSKNKLWVGVLILVFNGLCATGQPIQVSCQPCQELRTCNSGTCARYAGTNINGFQQCLSTTACPKDYPFYYFPQTCQKDSNGFSCRDSCCVKLSTASSASKTCTDSFQQSKKFCSSATVTTQGQTQSYNGGAIAGIVIGVIVGIAALFLLSCCIYHQCYAKKNKKDQVVQTEHAKTVRQSRKNVQEGKQKYHSDRTNTKKSLCSQSNDTGRQRNTAAQERKKRGVIKTKKSTAEIMEIYGKPLSKSEAALETAQDMA